MKKWLFLGAVFCCMLGFSQEENSLHEFSLDYFYGSILEHNKAIGHLITKHPEGVILSYNRKTYGKNTWEAAYNYPDYGATAIFQNMKNPYLGENIGVYAHYNFYFLNRKLQFRLGQGLAYASNPYDSNNNYENNAYGSHFLATTFVMLNYKHANIFKGLGLQAGLTVIHYSNANVKAPNTSTNTLAANIGVNYLLKADKKKQYKTYEKQNVAEPIHFNFIARGGINASDVIGMKSYPFYTLGVFADKRLSLKSSVLLGTEVFFSPMLKELIRYRGIAYPEENISGDESSMRAGVFLGYQLHLGKNSIFANAGYYYYYPYDFEGQTYLRAGIQREISKHLFGSISVKAHAAKAEAVEFTIGYRL